MRRTWTCIAFLLLAAASLNAQDNYYYYRGVDSTYSVRLVGAGVNTDGQTLNMTWDSDLGVWKTTVTRTGLYYRYEDPNGGTTFSLDSKGTLIRIGTDIEGAALLGRIADADDDGAIDLGTAEDSTLSLAKLTTAAYNFVGAGGTVTNNPDDKTTENTSGSAIGIRETVYLSSEYYSTLASAVSAAGANDRTLLVTTALETANHDTIPANITLDFRSGGALSNASGTDTVYIFGHVQAPPRQIFPADVKVYWAPITGNTNTQRGYGLNDKFYAEWWGAAGDSSTNSTTALQEAINASISRGAWIQLLDGYYLVNATLVVNSWCRIRGTNIGKSYIKLMDNSNVHLMRTGLYGAAMDLEGFVLDANGNNQTGGSALVIAQFTGGPVTIRNMIIRNGADYGVYGTSQNLLLTESQIDQNGKGGVWFRNGNVYTVSNNHIQAQDSGAVFQLKFSNATPDTVYWTLDSTVSTINTSATEFISANTIFSNHFESGDVVGDSMRYVVWLDNSDGNTFIGNEFSFNNSLTDVSAAVYVDSGSGQNTFIGNNVQQGNGSSWRIMGQDNIFMGNKTRGATPSTSDTLAAIYINPGQGNLWWDTERYASGKSDETGFYGAGRFNFFGTDSLTVANTEIKRISGNTYIDATTSDLNLRSPSGTLRMESSTGRYYLGSGNFFQVISDTLCWIKSSPAETTRVAPPRP